MFYSADREVPECEVDRECSIGHICENTRCIGKNIIVFKNLIL